MRSLASRSRAILVGQSRYEDLIRQEISTIPHSFRSCRSTALLFHGVVSGGLADQFVTR